MKNENLNNEAQETADLTQETSDIEFSNDDDLSPDLQEFMSAQQETEAETSEQGDDGQEADQESPPPPVLDSTKFKTIEEQAKAYLDVQKQLSELQKQPQQEPVNFEQVQQGIEQKYTNLATQTLQGYAAYSENKDAMFLLNAFLSSGNMEYYNAFRNSLPAEAAMNLGAELTNILNKANQEQGQLQQYKEQQEREQIQNYIGSFEKNEANKEFFASNLNKEIFNAYCNTPEKFTPEIVIDYVNQIRAEERAKVEKLYNTKRLQYNQNEGAKSRLISEASSSTTGKPSEHIFTRAEIAQMSPEKFTKYQNTILSQAARGLTK